MDRDRGGERKGGGGGRSRLRDESVLHRTGEYPPLSSSLFLLRLLPLPIPLSLSLSLSPLSLALRLAAPPPIRDDLNREPVCPLCSSRPGVRPPERTDDFSATTLSPFSLPTRASRPVGARACVFYARLFTTPCVYTRRGVPVSPNPHHLVHSLLIDLILASLLSGPLLIVSRLRTSLSLSLYRSSSSSSSSSIVLSAFSSFPSSRHRTPRRRRRRRRRRSTTDRTDLPPEPPLSTIHHDSTPPHHFRAPLSLSTRYRHRSSHHLARTPMYYALFPFRPRARPLSPLSSSFPPRARTHTRARARARAHTPPPPPPPIATHPSTRRARERGRRAREYYTRELDGRCRFSAKPAILSVLLLVPNFLSLSLCVRVSNDGVDTPQHHALTGTKL